MSQSPSSAGAMGLGSLLNNQSGEFNMADEQQEQRQQQPGQQQSQVHPAFMMDRPNSPHGSEHSRYSGPMNTSYPSPTVSSRNGMVSYDAIPPMPVIPPVPTVSGVPPILPPASAPQAAKAYPCSTCGKGFARRSDLARHGKHPCCCLRFCS